MKNTIILTVFFICTSVCNGQTDVSKLMSKISLCFDNYTPGPKKQIYLNSKELVLDIDDYQIPLNLISIKYESNPKTVNGVKREGLVIFKCPNECISGEDETFSSVGFAFKSKKEAYYTIEIINELIKELEK